MSKGHNGNRLFHNLLERLDSRLMLYGPFNIGDSVYVDTSIGVNVRSSASAANTLNIIGSQSLNAQGVVIGGPSNASGYNWYNINWNNSAVDGWSIENNISKTAVTPTTYSLSPNPGSVNENGGSISFTITRSGGLPAETIYATTTQTEGYTNNSDYTGILNQGVSFGANQTQATVTVNITNDSVVESNEVFGLIVQRNTSDPVGTYLAKTTFTINNDDTVVTPTTYSLSPNPGSVNENGGSISFTITRSGNMPAETVYVSTTQTEGFTNSSDYTSLLNKSIAFTAGQASNTVTVTITNDSIVESAEKFGLIVQRNTSDPVTTYLAKTTFTINNDDTTSTLPAPTNLAATVISATQINLTWTDNASNEQGYKIEKATSSSGPWTQIAQYAANSTGYPSTGLATGTTYYYRVRAYTATENSAYSNVASATPSATTTSYSVSPNPGSVNENGGSITFTITRSGNLPAETLYASTTQTEGFTNSSDYTSLLNKSVSFIANQASATVVVTITNDNVVESDEKFALIVQRNTTDPVTTFLTRSTFTIKNDDTSGSNLLPAPTISSPIDGATNQSKTLTIKWNAISGASSYRIMIARISNDLPISNPDAYLTSGSIIINATPSTNSYSVPSGILANNTKYYISVKARGTTAGLWSGIVGFTTASNTTTVSPVLMTSGFYYPVPFVVSSDRLWLAQGDAYITGKVHFGNDIVASKGTNVYAVSNGTVMERKADGFGNEVIFVLHKSSSGPFVAVYGHIKGLVLKGSTVTAGQLIGTVADYNADNSASNDHLHFGIRPGSTYPASDGINYGWGRATVAWYNANGTNGFVAPIAYLTSKTPVNARIANDLFSSVQILDT